ncbi:unnamed protein product, partial [Strongylus vulgaris]
MGQVFFLIYKFWHYVVLRFAQEDFYHCVAAARVNGDELEKGVAALRQNVTKLENCLKTYQKQGDDDSFVEVMSPFLSKAQGELDIITTLHSKMKSDWANFSKYYAFDTKKYPMEQFFADMKTFKEQYEGVYRELEMERLRAEKESEDFCPLSGRAALQRQRSRGADFLLREALENGSVSAYAPRTPLSVIPPAPEK